MSGYQPSNGDPRMVEQRARNRRTGLILASIALVFFVGVILKYALSH